MTSKAKELINEYNTVLETIYGIDACGKPMMIAALSSLWVSLPKDHMYFVSPSGKLR